MWNTIKEGYSGVFRHPFNRIAVVAMILTSMLFGLLPVTAFWNPEDRMKDFPVAVVNLDTGTYGAEIVNNLAENDNVTWEFYEENIFAGGIEQTDYNFGFVITENFSANVESARGGSPEPAEIVYVANMRKNFMMSQFAKNVKTVMEQMVSAAITQEYATGAFEALFAINEGIPAFTDGIAQLDEGARALQSNLTSLNAAITALGDGAGNMDAAQQLSEASASLAYGVEALAAGVSELAAGAAELQLAAAEDAGGETVVNSAEEIGAFIAEPVVMTSAIYGEIKNYGSGFAPLFMSLGLWIGGLMLFFIIPVKTPQNAQLSRGKIVFGRYFVLGTFGICEALAITGGALLLGVEAVNVPIFMLFACVLSLTFLGIFQLVHLLAGDLVSKAICIIVAIVQIAAAGGTFPVELTSPFFMAIHPYLPLTYSIDGFREIISGGNWSGLLGTTGIFAIILVCAWGLSLLVCKRKTERAVVGEAVEAKA